MNRRLFLILPAAALAAALSACSDRAAAPPAPVGGMPEKPAGDKPAAVAPPSPGSAPSPAVPVPVPTPAPAAAPAFQGFGAKARGGEGGKVIEITSLDDSGPGTLRAAVDADGPRIVIFKVEGTIDLKKPLNVKKPFLTIDGTTAPGKGVTIKGSLLVNYKLGGRGEGAHNLVFRGLRVRDGYDTIALYATHDVVVDHCSLGPAQDGALDVVGGSRDVTVSWCVFSGTYKALLVGYDAKNVSVHRNVFHDCGSRNPQGQKHAVLDVRNNIAWNFSDYGTRFAGKTTGNIVNNYYYQDNLPRMDAAISEFGWESPAAHIRGNEGPWGPIEPGRLHNAGDPIEAPAVETWPVAQAVERVLDGAGARPLDERDAKAVEGMKSRWAELKKGPLELPKVDFKAVEGTAVEGGGRAFEAEAFGLTNAETVEEDGFSGKKAIRIKDITRAAAVVKVEPGRHSIEVSARPGDATHDALVVVAGGVRHRIVPDPTTRAYPPIEVEAKDGELRLILQPGEAGVVVDRIVIKPAK